MPIDKSFFDGIPWAIAVIGWACTHMLSEARERRKEIRSQLDKAYEQLQKLEQEARGFHCALTFDAAKSIELTSRLFTLERTFQRINIVNMDNLNPYIIGLRRGITLQNFDKSSFQTQDLTSTILLDISGAACDLEDSLETRYLMHYPRTFPYFSLKKPS